jgi:hypothetical protein
MLHHSLLLTSAASLVYAALLESVVSSMLYMHCNASVNMVCVMVSKAEVIYKQQ